MNWRFSQLWRSLSIGLIAISFLLVVQSGHSLNTTALVPFDQLVAQVRSAPNLSTSTFPDAKPHPLPPTLAQWQLNGAGDYFDQIEPVTAGYLVWSEFPVRVYIEPLQPAEAANTFLRGRSQTWINAMQQATQAWNRYLPLQLVEQSETADITIWRQPPPLRFERDELGEPRPSRARSAETRFELYVKSASPAILAHRFIIHLRPDQAAVYLLAAARHELGHALGIWGHSPLETDALYFAQVRHPPQISPRDVNTLKRIYQQPTRLGWQLLTAGG